MDDERVNFSPLVVNELDPLSVFSDAVFHAACVHKHPLGSKALSMYSELRAKTSPSNRRCIASGRLITEPDRYIGVGILTSDEKDPLYCFNFAQFDRAALVSWPGRKQLAALLADALESGRLKGKGVEWLRSQIENPQPMPSGRPHA